MDGKIMTECRYSEVEGRSSHFHNAYEMLFVRGGSGTITVSSREYKVEANTLMFFSNLEEHVTKIDQVPFCRYFVKLDPDQLNRQLSNNPWQLSIFKNRPEGFIPHVGDFQQETGILKSHKGAFFEQEVPLLPISLQQFEISLVQIIQNEGQDIMEQPPSFLGDGSRGGKAGIEAEHLAIQGIAFEDVGGHQML